MLTDKELQAALDACPAERVTPEYMASRIEDVSFTVFNTLTYCRITLDNGYIVTGESACVDPANYKAEIGEKIAYDRAFNALWPLFGFLLAEKRHHQNKGE